MHIIFTWNYSNIQVIISDIRYKVKAIMESQHHPKTDLLERIMVSDEVHPSRVKAGGTHPAQKWTSCVNLIWQVTKEV